MMAIVKGALSLTDALTKALSDQAALNKPNAAVSAAAAAATSQSGKIVGIPVTPANCRAAPKKAANALDAAASIQLSVGCAVASIAAGLKAVAAALGGHKI